MGRRGRRHPVGRAGPGPTPRRPVPGQPGRHPRLAGGHDRRRPAVAGRPAGDPGALRRPGHSRRHLRRLGEGGRPPPAVEARPPRVPGVAAVGPAHGGGARGRRGRRGGRQRPRHRPARPRRHRPSPADVELQHPTASSPRQPRKCHRRHARRRTGPAGTEQRRHRHARRPASDGRRHRPQRPALLRRRLPVGGHVGRGMGLLRPHVHRLRRPRGRDPPRRRRPGRGRHARRPGRPPAR